MSVRETFSRLKKGVKRRFKGRKHNQDGESVGSSGARTDLEESLSRSGSPFAGVSDRNPEGSGFNPVEGHISSADRPAQRDKSEPVPAGGGKTNQGDGEGDVDQIEPSRAQRPRPHSNVEAVTGAGHGEKADQVPSKTLIPDSAKPDGM